jgi:hypothetical protein
LWSAWQAASGRDAWRACTMFGYKVTRDQNGRVSFSNYVDAAYQEECFAETPNSL